MTTKLDWNHLRRRLSQPLERLTPYVASDLAMLLDRLARWCLNPNVLMRAAENDSIPEEYRAEWRQTPQLPATHGACWVIFATDFRAPLPLLRPAFVLPLQWVQGRKHSPRLPAALEQLATEVAASFPANNRIAGQDWGLQLAEDLGDLDLSDMPLECQSGWAALAAGLLVAAEGGTPDPQVWATGSWDDRRGILPVEGLKPKLDLAAEFGARAFFVPSVQAEEAAQLAHGLEIGRLQMSEREPGRALSEFTLRLETPPPPPCNPDDSPAFERCVDYYSKRPRGRSGTTQFYWSHLLPAIIQRCRGQVRCEYGACRPTHMVTIVSGSPELVLLAARALDVRHCLLLYTPDTASRRDQTAAMQMVKELLEADDRHCLPWAFRDDETLEREIPNAVRQFAEGRAPESLVLDLTPGTKWMTWVADRAMPHGSWRLYVRNDTLSAPDHRVRPGSEQLVCWRAAQASGPVLSNSNSVSFRESP